MSSKPGPDPDADARAILTAIALAYSPVLGTSDIADRVGVARQTADRHLRDLSDDGLVNTRMIGQVRVWWLTDQGRRFVDPEN